MKQPLIKWLLEYNLSINTIEDILETLKTLNFVFETLISGQNESQEQI